MPNNISNIGFGDYSADQRDIERRRMMAQKLQEQSMQPLETNQMAGGWAIPISPTQGLAKMLQAYTAGKGLEKAKEDERALAQRMRTEATDWAGGIPQPTTRDLNPVSMDDEGNVVPPTMQTTRPSRQEMMAQMLKGISSGNPITAQLAGPMLAQYMKQDEPFSLREGEKRFGPGNTLIAENEKRVPLHFANTGNAIVPMNQFTGTPEGPATPVNPAPLPNDPNKPFMPNGTPNPAYQEYVRGNALAGATRVQTNVNAFTPASEEAQRDFIKSTRTTYDQLKQVPVALESIEKAKALIPASKGFMGPGGETLLEAAKFLNNRVGTNINTDGIKNAEELRTRIFFNIMDNLKKMDAQPSQQQQQIMQESLGKLGTDPNALPAILDAFGDAMRGKVDLHNREVQGAIQRGVKFPYDPLITIKKTSFATEAEAQAAGLEPGTRVIINGVSGTWR
jgi:hypothetical protein